MPILMPMRSDVREIHSALLHHCAHRVISSFFFENTKAVPFDLPLQVQIPAGQRGNCLSLKFSHSNYVFNLSVFFVNPPLCAPSVSCSGIVLVFCNTLSTHTLFSRLIGKPGAVMCSPLGGNKVITGSCSCVCSRLLVWEFLPEMAMRSRGVSFVFVWSPCSQTHR